MLEKTYAVFSIRPYSKGIAKVITKTPKVYLYDNGEIDGDIGPRLENLVANHLFKRRHFLEDVTGDSYELCYLRDKQGHEIDFVVVKNKKAVMLIEVKVSDDSRSKSFYYYKERLKINHCVQLVMNIDKTSTKDNILVTPVLDWLSKPLDEKMF